MPAISERLKLMLLGSPYSGHCRCRLHRRHHHHPGDAAPSSPSPSPHSGYISPSDHHPGDTVPLLHSAMRRHRPRPLPGEVAVSGQDRRGGNRNVGALRQQGGWIQPSTNHSWDGSSVMTLARSCLATAVSALLCHTGVVPPRQSPSASP